MWCFFWNPVSFKNSLLSLLPAALTLWSTELQLGGGAMTTTSLHLVKRHTSHPNVPWGFENLLWLNINDHAYSKKLWASLTCNIFISFSSFVGLSGPWGHHQPSLSMPSLPGLPSPCPCPHVSHLGHQPLPCQCHSRDSLQLHTALPCPAIGPAEPGPPTSWHPSSPSAHMCPQGSARWLGLPWCPHLPSSWLVLKTGLQKVPTTCWRNQP